MSIFCFGENMEKITFLMLHLNYGGLEKQTITLINELAKSKKYNITIISVYDMLNGKSFYDIDENVEIKFLCDFGPDHKAFFEAKKNKKIINLIKQSFIMLKCSWYKYIKLKRIIRKLNTDIIVSTRIEFAKQIKRHDTLNITQEHSYIDTKKYISKIRKSFKFIDYIIVMTQSAKKLYNKSLDNYNKFSKVLYVPNMIDEVTQNSSNLTNNQFISIGRLEEVKDIRSLINMFNILCKDNNKLKLDVIGDGSQRNELEDLVKKLNLSNNISFLGRLNKEQINEKLLNSCMLISTSKSESFSLVIVEAMSLGVPCISFDIDVGPREIILNEYNGYLIKNRNINEMANVIKNVINNSNKLSTLSKNAKESVKKFQSSIVVKRWEEILEEKR